MAFYVPGDASGAGFGSAIIKDGEIKYQCGAWKDQWRKESSNFREASNLVMRIEELVLGREAAGQEVFLFTDNMVFESTFYKGHSKTSSKLSGIILRLRKAERDGGLVLHVIHVAGTRMKDWGVDGLSRGDLLEGMLAGKDPLSFIPLSKGANERSEGRVAQWVKSWWRGGGPVKRGGKKKSKPWLGAELEEITKEKMFELHKTQRPRLWMPPPAAMETVMELFNEDRIAHPRCPHVFVVPRLMTHLWRRNLGKDADLLCTIAVGDHFWSRDQHEPLILAVVLPLAHVADHRGPWLARGTDEAERFSTELTFGFKLAKAPGKLGPEDVPERLHDVGGELWEMWKDPVARGRNLLLQFLDWAGRLPPVRECMVRGLLHGKPERSVSAAPGNGKVRRRGERYGVGRPGGGARKKRKKRGPPDGQSL